MFVGLISDTHGVFSDQFREFLSPVDVIWHAGDFGGGATFAQEMAAFKPLVGVHGNCDGQDIRFLHPSFQFLQAEGQKILMTHIGGSPGHYDIRARALIDNYKPDIFICGHSHILKVMEDRDLGFLYMNPGAAGLQGWQVYRTALRFRLEAGTIHSLEVCKVERGSR